MMGEEYSSYSSEVTEETMSTVMQRVFKMMTAGLLVTALVSAFILNTPSALYFIARTMWGWIIAELILVFYLSLRVEKLGTSTCRLIFYLYAAVNGVTLAPLCYAYTEASLATTFLTTAITFGAMALVGQSTKRDLTKMGSFLMMGLIGVIVAAIINIFIQNSMVDFVITIIGLLIFIGLTAYDVQKIKRFASTSNMMEEDAVTKVVTMGALTLYLDFINIFIKLLRLMGRRKR